jgi:hypothetical protein
LEIYQYFIKYYNEIAIKTSVNVIGNLSETLMPILMKIFSTFSLQKTVETSLEILQNFDKEFNETAPMV